MRRIFPIIGILLAVLVGFYLWSNKAPQGKMISVKGVIKGFGDTTTQADVVYIHHETIPNYMDSMTMPFKIDEPKQLKAFQVGDAIQFTLHQTDEDTWISDLKRIPPDQVHLPDEKAALPVKSDVHYLQAGDAVPSLSLTNQEGKPINIQDWKGKTLALTYIYTHCPDPTLCPRISGHFKTLQDQLKAANLSDKVQLLSISFDPKNDTPQVLKEYAKRHKSDLSNWSFATGSVEEISKAAQLFGVNYRDNGGNLIEHSLSTSVIAPNGNIVKLWRGNQWQPEEVMQEIKMVAK